MIFVLCILKWDSQLLCSRLIEIEEVAEANEENAKEWREYKVRRDGVKRASPRPSGRQMRMLDQRLAGHGCRLLDAHQLEDGRSDVSELSVLHFLYLVTCIHDDERNIVQ